MVPLPGGIFLFGADEQDPFKKQDELPQVKLKTAPIWVGKTEVTWREYREYMKLYAVFKEFEAIGKRKVDPDNLSDAITAPTELYEPTFTFEYGEETDQPAVTMTQYAAQQYTKWLSLLTGNQYRLPTEAEWEYSCGAGSKGPYHPGVTFDNLKEFAWYMENNSEQLPKVATKLGNPFGLYDMHGGVAEWTITQYTADGHHWLAKRLTVEGEIQAVDATLWPTKSYPCVVKGGSWEMAPADLRRSARLPSDDEAWKSEDPNFPRSPWWYTSDPSRGVGFRVFRSYAKLGTETMKKFWETSAATTINEVETRVLGGRGGYGLVDPSLPSAIRDLGK
jgi:formylglycine-generating enzyme required for sulfatase activity